MISSRSTYTLLVFLSVIMISGCKSSGNGSEPDGPSVVFVEEQDGAFQLIVNDEPFYIKGAGGRDRLDTLAAYGGNSIRTWGVDNAQSILDDAYKKIAKIIKDVIPPEKRRSLENYLKEKERSLKHSLLKEKEKRLGELLTESKRSKETRDRISKLQMELYKSKMPLNMGLISPMGTSGDLREQYYGKQEEEEERNVDKFNNNISAQKLEAQLSNTSSVNSGIGVNSSPFGKGLNNANENNELRKMLEGNSGSLKNSKKKLTKKKK